MQVVYADQFARKGHIWQIVLQIVVVVLVQDCLLPGVDGRDVVRSVELVAFAAVVSGLGQRVLQNLVTSWQSPLSLTYGVVL